MDGRIRLSLVALSLVSACSGDALSPDRDSSSSAPADYPNVTSHFSTQIAVSTLDALYSAVNDPGNAGKRIELAPGTYLLDGTRANGGRLELQKDMTLAGAAGNESAVVIDASSLSAASLTDGAQLTGAVRLGRGHNVVEWLTVTKAVNGAAGITTDLFLAGTTVVTITHVAVSGGARGFDIRNVGASAAGRVLEVVLSNNNLSNNKLGGGQGIRIANLAGTKGATIHASLSGNQSHGNIAGLLGANVSADSATVVIVSADDHFDSNGNGAVLLGGNTAGAAIRGSVVRFSAFRSTFFHNTAPLSPVFPTRAGIAPYGGVTTIANRAFDNRVELDLHDVSFADNGGPDVRAWGAISSSGLPAGTGNVVTITLNQSATVETIASEPAQAPPTNHVIVHH
jgi:hypothetical protein